MSDGPEVMAARRHPHGPATVDAGGSPSGGTAAGLAHGVLALQRQAGNGAVARFLQREGEPVTGSNGGAGPSTAGRPDLEEGSADAANVELLQLMLNRHRGFRRQSLLLATGRFEASTARAVRRFKTNQGLAPANARVESTTWTALAAEPSATRSDAEQGPEPDYAHMTDDGLLDLTLATGFDEDGLYVTEARQLRRGLSEVRGFAANPARATELWRAAGRTQQGTANDLVKENVGTSEGRPVHAIVRLVAAPDDGVGGGAARTAALEGMNESDVFAYAGHARYGTGPDFSRKWTVRVHWDRFSAAARGSHAGDQDLLDVGAVLTTLGLGRDGARAVARLEAMVADGRVEVIGHPEGNIGVAAAAQTHPGEVGHYLMTEAVQGSPQPLGSTVTEDRYRLWLFNGCETRTYTPFVRAASPRLDTEHLDVVTNVVPPIIVEAAEQVLSFVDGIIANESVRALNQRMILNEHSPAGARYRGEGFEDNGS